MKDVQYDEDLYRAKLTLWVEDTLTRSFLTELWLDTDIVMRVAAGRDGVGYLVGGAPDQRRGRSVVGLVDRDLSAENTSKWRDLATPVLRTPGHEFENLLLDFPTFARLSGLPEADIEDVARTQAQALVWWMACKVTRYELHGATTAGFPNDPAVLLGGTAPHDAASAADHILDSPFWKERKSMVSHVWDETRVRESVDRHGQGFQGDLLTTRWLETFSGKEIYRELRARVPGLSRGADATPAQRDEDLAKRIARVMRTGKAPQVFTDLRAALRERAGLPP